MSAPAKSDRRRYHPTPAQWEWWRVTLANIARAFREPRETPAAVLASVDDDREQAVWLPKSQVEIEPKLVDGKHYATVTMPAWLATEKGLT